MDFIIVFRWITLRCLRWDLISVIHNVQRRIMLMAIFFCLKLIWRDVYLCLKSTVNRKSIYKKSNYIKVIIMIVSTSSSYLLRLVFRRFVVNAISEDISHEIPPLNAWRFYKNIFKLKQSMKKSSLFIIFRGYLSF